ncbi:GFA family protein [Ruegeria sp. PrR005]|uniref:GFA family protein n=1 Tax=Ruegeria sp. PrR005 TaxID=2706882 RepID=A0A6B2NW70_9RHOB|nr:GFA family protein [Ruegeria sp. PrR005]NDW46897.1 GFA family protein [Ruegeria sp. PrR005]
MDKTHAGGCLCGALRYEVSTPPLRLTWCTCRFCQKMTGTPMNALAGFTRSALRLVQGTPAIYTHVSEGSGKEIHLNSCPTCSTTVFLELERFPDFLGVMTGTLDDPDWFDRTPDNAKYIFTECAQKGTLVQAGFPVYPQHASDTEGNPQIPAVYDHHHLVHP